MKKVFVIVFILTSIFLNAQKSNIETSKIGFNVNFGKNSTRLVNYVENLAIKKDYETIKTLILSEDTSKQFLGVAICENLEKLNLISLSDENKNRIKVIYESEEKVSFLIGCKGSTRTLKELLNKEDNHLLRIITNEWFEKKIKTKLVDN
jgi:hypothetical protein